MIMPKIAKIPIDILINVVKNIWDIITESDKKQEEISNTKGFNPQKSEVNEIAELNKLLLEYRNNIINVSEQIERQMIIECTMQMQELLEIFENFNNSLKIVRYESVKRKFRILNEELKGTFADYINRKISLDNYECIKILKLPAGELKNQRLQELKQNAFIEASNLIVKKIKNTIDDFYETIEYAFLEHLDRAELSIQEKTNIFENLSKETENNTESIESTLLKANYILSICYYVDFIRSE